MVVATQATPVLHLQELTDTKARHGTLQVSCPPPFCGMALAHKFSCSMLQNSLVQTAQSLQDALFALKLPQCLLFACMQPGMTCTVHKVYPHWNFGSSASSLPTVVAKVTKVVRNLLALSERHLYENGSS